MSLRFVTRKLKTQTLGDDDGAVQSNVESEKGSQDKLDLSNKKIESTKVYSHYYTL